ncbi:MAG: IS110 family transposase [Thomasclavelia sp.]|nr:IS110 family transposase [Thomasclavelia sp.]
MKREDCIYVGIDLHKETHTAVILNCFNKKLGEITFNNIPSDYSKLLKKVNKCCPDDKEVVYGLENVYGYGRTLAVWLLERNCIVKDVNPSVSNRQAKHRGAMYKKSDRDDAQAIALATINLLDTLPNAHPDEGYWALSLLVHRRDNIMRQRIRLVNQLHEQLCMAYPEYKTFFCDIGRPTALYFWRKYPSRRYLQEMSAEELSKDLKEISHNRVSVKSCERILESIKADKLPDSIHQESRDAVTVGIVDDLMHYDKQLKSVEEEMARLYHAMNCTLTTIPGIHIITAVKILSCIGDIYRFSTPNKLAQFAGIAPLRLSSAGKGKDMVQKQGNGRLRATMYFLAIQSIQTSAKGKARNPIFREYFDKRVKEGKNKKQILICISRRLINIIYGMLKNGTEYRLER